MNMMRCYFCNNRESKCNCIRGFTTKDSLIKNKKDAIVCKRCGDLNCFGGCIPFGYATEDSKVVGKDGNGNDIREVKVAVGISKDVFEKVFEFTAKQFGYEKDGTEGLKQVTVSDVQKVCPECQNNPYYISATDEGEQCQCRLCGGYSEVPIAKIGEGVFVLPEGLEIRLVNPDFDCGHLTVKESYNRWRSSLSPNHWKLYKNMPNTLSEDAYAAGYKAGLKRRRGSK